jgi:probable HAF family extracellular repeat protein
VKTLSSHSISLSLVLLVGQTLSAQTYYKATTLQTFGVGTPRYGTLAVVGINNSGAIVGAAELPGGGTHATLWSPNGTIRDLGTLGGPSADALAINNLGQVVGASATSGNLKSDPFLWTESGGMQDLGTLGPGQQNEAHAINDSTQVAGLSCLDPGNQVCRAFLWTQSAGMKDLGSLGGNLARQTESILPVTSSDFPRLLMARDTHSSGRHQVGCASLCPAKPRKLLPGQLTIQTR